MLIKPKFTVKVTSNTGRMMAGLTLLQNRRLLVGWPEQTAARTTMEMRTVMKEVTKKRKLAGFDVTGKVGKAVLGKTLAKALGTQKVMAKRKVMRATGEQNITNAALAYIHDNGSPIAHIPARPFLRTGIESVQDKIAFRLEKAAYAALEGDAAAADQQLHAAGLVAVTGVRTKIQTGPFQSLAARTLAARKRRGFKGTKPLIVTGQLRNSCTYVLEGEGQPLQRSEPDQQEPEEQDKLERAGDEAATESGEAAEAGEAAAGAAEAGEAVGGVAEIAAVAVI